MNRRSRSRELKAKEETQYEGNRSLLPVTQIAAKHRMQLLVPASIIIGATSDKNKLIYTDPITAQLVVKTGYLSPPMIS